MSDTNPAAIEAATPRVDAEVDSTCGISHARAYHSLLILARQLERELAAAQLQIEELKEAHERDIDERNNGLATSCHQRDKLQQQIDQLKRENGVMREALTNVVAVWRKQCGRVFESMGHENPRALVIDESIDKARTALNSTTQEKV